VHAYVYECITLRATGYRLRATLPAAGCGPRYRLRAAGRATGCGLRAALPATGCGPRHWLRDQPAARTLTPAVRPDALKPSALKLGFKALAP
jgi:hypothetical protein